MCISWRNLCYIFKITLFLQMVSIYIAETIIHGPTEKIKKDTFTP